jgi:hypothetical protein
VAAAAVAVAAAAVAVVVVCTMRDFEDLTFVLKNQVLKYDVM